MTRPSIDEAGVLDQNSSKVTSESPSHRLVLRHAAEAVDVRPQLGIAKGLRRLSRSNSGVIVARNFRVTSFFARVDATLNRSRERRTGALPSDRELLLPFLLQRPALPQREAWSFPCCL